MKIELDFDDDVAEIVFKKILRQDYEGCSVAYRLREDRKYYRRLKKAVQILWDHHAVPGEKIHD